MDREVTNFIKFWVKSFVLVTHRISCVYLRDSIQFEPKVPKYGYLERTNYQFTCGE